MKPILILIIQLIIVGATASQSNWDLKPKIEKEDYFLLKGNIGEKYPITMYLTYSWDYCGKRKDNRWNARGLKGWYYYDKLKKKIPLVGAMKCSDPNHFTKLFVSENILDTVHGQTCNVEYYKEMFTNESCFFFEKMRWEQSGKNGALPVHLKTVHDFSWKTNVTIVLELNELEIRSFNLTELTENEFIENVQILTKKATDNYFYSIIKFGHPTNPGSSGSGHCGAGYERYIGFLEINNELESEKFEYYKTSSCLEYIDEEKYGYEVDFPAKGIIIKK